MEEDKIKELFKDFQPEISSSVRFMAKLQKNMATVELVKQHNLRLKKRNLLAVTVAAVSGFVMGVIMTILFPIMMNKICALSISFAHLNVGSLSVYGNIAVWSLMVVICIITALNAYEITLARLSAAESKASR